MVQWDSEAGLFGWVLNMAWEAGRLLPPVLAPYMPVAVEDIPQLLRSEGAAMLASLEPHDQAELLTWVRFALRGYGADAVEAGDVLVVLGSSSALRPVTAIPVPQEVLLMAAAAPAPDAAPQAPPRKVRPKPKVHTVRGASLEQDSLLSALGLHIRPAKGEAHCQHIASVASLRGAVLEEATELGLLTAAQAYMPLARVGVAVDQSQSWITDLLEHAARLEWHPKVAVALCAPFRSKLRGQGFEGVEFADGTMLVFPHYALRGLSKSSLWRELCGM